MNEETKTSTQKPSCPYRKLLGNICLIVILAIFCILEIAVLVLIFSIFSIAYVALLAIGGCYLVYKVIRKIINHHSNKESTQD